MTHINNLIELKKRVSWGSVFGGVVTVLAVSILLSVLGSSIGLFLFDPFADNPVSGIGTTVGIGTAVALIVSMVAGGFVAGKLAGVDGLIHGFLVWGTTLIVGTFFCVLLTAGAAKLTMNALGAASSVAGGVISGTGSVVGGGVSALSDQAKDLFGEIDFKVDLKHGELPKNIRAVLVKSKVKELQPDYLQKQLEGVKADFGKSVKKAIASPQDADEIFKDFLARVKEQTNKLTKSIDRNDLARALANNTDMSKAEADKAVKQYTEIMQKATAEADKQIQNLEQNLDKAIQEWQEVKQNALEAADKATDAAARSALVSFFAILIGAVLCSLAGVYGSRKTQERIDM
ncbi:TIGR04086 family membrane protein [Parabacteroides johnsonii]|jgi:putative uncharacterized protein (fragment)|uniref:TIGR04086 family membrane protein n=1 Tax=Parabacteroides johnsonii TaxID=387661 RepID=UPI001C8BCD35|nr:TIGR04086 family membrane protein [Parabacteroides johnsonii]MBX9108510.1 hypothetical protein [Parabacteroides johnsonii]